MTETLTICLRVAGVGLLSLAALHVPISRYLKWREEGAKLTPVNAAVFRVHAFFVCLVLVMMGLPCLIDPGIFLERTRAGAWLSWLFAVFWAIRLYCQWFVYGAELWRKKKFETGMHWTFSLLWAALALLFAVCGAKQVGWLP